MENMIGRIDILRFFLKVPIYLYKLCISPYITPSCRFVPTCSTYAVNALTRLPLKVAMIYIVKRILKCNPFNKSDRLDEI